MTNMVDQCEELCKTTTGRKCVFAGKYIIKSFDNESKRFCKKHVHIGCNKFIAQNKEYEIFLINPKTKELMKSTVAALNIKGIMKVPTQAPIQARPIQARPIQARPIQARPIQALQLGNILNHEQAHPCSICFEDTKDIFCRSNRHVLCETCFESHVQSEAEKPDFAGFIKCPHVVLNECDCIGYSICLIAKTVSDTTFQKLDDARYKLKEKQVIAEVSEQLEKTHIDNQSQDPIKKETNFIIDNILTLRCPNSKCKQAYVDFDGCMKITCSKCKTVFCGKCHKTLDWLPYVHITTCCGGVFMTPREIKTFQTQYRTIKLKDYLKHKKNKTLILDSLKKELKDLGIIYI